MSILPKWLHWGREPGWNGCRGAFACLEGQCPHKILLVNGAIQRIAHIPLHFRSRIMSRGKSACLEGQCPHKICSLTEQYSVWLTYAYLYIYFGSRIMSTIHIGIVICGAGTRGIRGPGTRGTLLGSRYCNNFNTAHAWRARSYYAAMELRTSPAHFMRAHAHM